MANDHQLFIVKANDGETVRLAHFLSLFTNGMPFEVVMLGLPPEEINHPMLETGRLVWWTPNDRIYCEGAVGDKPSVITSKPANSYQFKTGLKEGVMGPFKLVWCERQRRRKDDRQN